MELNSVVGSALLLGFLVLVSFCNKEGGYPLETRTDDRCLFSLEITEGFVTRRLERSQDT